MNIAAEPYDSVVLGQWHDFCRMTIDQIYILPEGLENTLVDIERDHINRKLMFQAMTQFNMPIRKQYEKQISFLLVKYQN